MRRPLVAMVGVLAVLVVTATATVAVSVDRHPDGPRHSMMWGGPDGGPDWRSDGRGHRPGPGSTTEFGYLSEMVAHHEEAVAAAGELQRSDRPEMREFGESIVASQTAQIDQMNGWLSDWYPGQSTDVDYQPMMRDLTDLTGDRLDRVFLEDMIGHHMMAVMMSQHLLMSGVADHEEVNALAEDIRDEQHAEIFQMQRWLADWFDAGWRGMGRGMGGAMGHGMGGMGHGMGGMGHGMGHGMGPGMGPFGR